jgi:hypothetical protein
MRGLGGGLRASCEPPVCLLFHIHFSCVVSLRPLPISTSSAFTFQLDSFMNIFSSQSYLLLLVFMGNSLILFYFLHVGMRVSERGRLLRLFKRNASF